MLGIVVAIIQRTCTVDAVVMVSVGDIGCVSCSCHGFDLCWLFGFCLKSYRPGHVHSQTLTVSYLHVYSRIGGVWSERLI